MTDTAGAGRTEVVSLRLAQVLAVLLIVLAVAWAAGIHRSLRLLIYTEQFLAAALALAVAHTFLVAHAKSTVLRGINTVLAGVALLGGGALAVTYPQLSFAAAMNPAAAVLPATAVLVTLMVSLVRVAGWPIAVIIFAFIAYGLFGSALPGPWQALRITPERLAVQLALDTGGVLGTPLAIAATVVVVFVAFGKLLELFGGAVFFTDLAIALMGRFRGGAAKIALLASAMFGSISGSAVSNVATTGIVTIPLMQRGGFKRETAAGIEATASTGGQLTPPVMGAAAFLMAEFLEVPYASVILAALIPALLYYLALFVLVDLTAARDGIEGIEDDKRGAASDVLRKGWPYLLPFVALLVGLFGLNYQPATAGLLAGGTLLLCALTMPSARAALAPGRFFGALAGGGGALAQIIIITGAAGIVIGVLNETGLGFSLTRSLVTMAGDASATLLVFAAVISIVLGMGMPTIAVYVLLAALVAPALVRLGLEPMSAHLFVLYFGMMSMITPPVAIAAFSAASISGARPMSTAFEAMKFGWPAYVLPFAFALNPALIMQEGLFAALPSVAGATIGVLCISAGIIGYLHTHLGLVARAGLIALGCVAAAAPIVLKGTLSS